MQNVIIIISVSSPLEPIKLMNIIMKSQLPPHFTFRYLQPLFAKISGLVSSANSKTDGFPATVIGWPAAIVVSLKIVGFIVVFVAVCKLLECCLCCRKKQ